MSAHVSQSLRLVFEGKEQESTALTLFIGMIQSESDSIPANCIQAMLTMVAKRSLNPADINQLYQVLRNARSHFALTSDVGVLRTVSSASGPDPRPTLLQHAHRRSLQFHVTEGQR